MKMNTLKLTSLLLTCSATGCGEVGFSDPPALVTSPVDGVRTGHKPKKARGDGVCLCGLPELNCEVNGVPGPRCSDAEDCSNWCTGGAPTCAPGPGELPGECLQQGLGCFFVEQSCGS